MCTKELAGGWYVVDEHGDQFDGPYPEQADARRAAYELDHRLESLTGEAS